MMKLNQLLQMYNYLKQNENLKTIEECCKKWKISNILLNNLHNHKITHFFPIQYLGIPAIIDSDLCNNSRDICISAPTGSGKSLVYIIPIIQNLMNRVICRLRALVILPTRDLAIQTYNVLSEYIIGTNLKVGLITGQRLFKNEQNLLVGEDINGLYYSKIDILVSTPGRLRDHIQSTNGFTLEHIQYLIIDEADRLLSQTYNQWIDVIYNNIYHMSQNGKITYENNNINIHTTTWRVKPSSINTNLSLVPYMIMTPLRRILLSATLSTDPNQLSKLLLINPLVITYNTNEVGSLPKTLTEYCVKCNEYILYIILDQINYYIYYIY